MFISPEIRDSRWVSTYNSQVRRGKGTRKSTVKSTVIAVPVVETQKR